MKQHPNDLWWTRHFLLAPTTPATTTTTTSTNSQQQPVIPPEFPGVVYDALRAFPDAMDAVDKAAQEFYARRVPR